ncbi:hypothetical protein D3C85_1446230 [compost metagenome]
MQDAVGEETAGDIRRALENGEVKRVLIRTKEDGSVTGKLLDPDGMVIRGKKGLFF